MGLCKPHEAQQEPECGAAPVSGQPLVSAQAGGWTDGEQPCPEGLGDAGDERLDMTQQCALSPES